MLSKITSNLKKRKVLVKILSSSFLSLPVSIMVSLITFRYIEPYYMGVWATVTIIETYTGFMRIGIINGMNRELPYAMGQGKNEIAMKYAETTLAYTLFTMFLLILISPFVLLNVDISYIFLIALVVGVIKILLTQYSSYLGGTYRTTDNFNKLSNIQFTMIAVKLSLVPLVYFMAFNGYLIMQLVLIVVNTYLLYRYRPFKVKPSFNKHVFIDLFKVGFPVFLSSYAVGFIATFPKLFILNFGDVNLLGLYAPILMMITIFSNLPNTLNTYFYPKLSYALGKDSDAKKLYYTILKVYGVSILLIIPIVVFAYFFLDYFVILFPKYSESLPYIEISLFIAPFVIAKLGNMVSIILKQINFMGYYVGFYAFFQLTYLGILYIFVSKDILYCSILSQILTFGSLLLVSIGLNYKAVQKYQSLHEQ